MDEGDADCVGVGVGVDEGACVGVEPHVPEVSGDCRIVRFSRTTSSVMRTVIPPSDVLPHEGEDAGLARAVLQRGGPAVVRHVRHQGADTRPAHDLDGLTLRRLDRQVLPGLPAHGDLLGCADRRPGQVEGDGAQGTRALYGGDRPIDGFVARGVADRGAERGDRLLCRLGADGGRRQRDDDAENRTAWSASRRCGRAGRQSPGTVRR